MRYEFAENNMANGEYRSMRALVEADCDGFRLRSRQTTSFTGANLSGEGVNSEGEDWFFPGPDTLHEAVLTMACAPAE